MNTDPWILKSEHPFITHVAEPLYLANGVFGGLLDGSGTNMDVWSASVGSRNAAAPECEVRYPVTLFRSRFFYRNAYFRKKEFWIGRDGIWNDDTRYTADPAMPHLPQVYQIRQQLDLRQGVAETEAVLYPGSEAALLAGHTPERKIPLRSRVVFLKDSPWMVMEVHSDTDTDILFAPEWIFEEHLQLNVSAQGICKIGSGIDCTLQLQQTRLSEEIGPDCATYCMQGNGGLPHEIFIHAPGTQRVTLQGKTAFLGRGCMHVRVRVLPPEHPPTPLPDDVFAEQARRWETFWSHAEVSLPATEALWQQRYHASLFYVAQSIGRGPTHPTGLSKPNYPHWIGCFHDTDTYFCRPLLETGRSAEAQPHLEYRHRYLAEGKRLAAGKGLSGVLYPWQSDMNGTGEAFPCLINSAIIACEAFHHFQYARQPATRQMAKDILMATFDHLLSFVERDAVPLQLKPGNLLTFSETMLAERPAEAVLSVRAVAEALIECGDLPDDVSNWARRIGSEMVLHRNDEGGYRFCPDDEPEYLRCPSILLGAFPLHHLKPNADLQATFDHELSKIVFLFAWLPHQASAVASRLQRREGPTSASQLLRQADRFYKDNHAYDEWENRRTGRAESFITAAGGFCTALHHLLLAETGDGEWSLFPGIPSDWQDIAFRNLHTRAGWVVSAELKAGQLISYHAQPVVQESADERFTLLFNGQSLDLPREKSSLR